jgi:hypothetical protein
MVAIPNYLKETSMKTVRVLRPWVSKTIKFLIPILVFVSLFYFGGQFYLYREKVLLEAAKIRAERLRIEATAEAEANKILENTITNMLIEYKKTTKEK